jgi:hypothetical protein
MTSEPVLWHYTSEGCRDEIGYRGVLRPSWTTEFVWLTDIDRPDCTALGIENDKTHRFRVTDADHAVRWSDIRYQFPRLARFVDAFPGGQPDRYWVCSNHVPVVYDPVAAA